MAAVPININFVGQKITRNTQVAGQEDAWTVTNVYNGQTQLVLIIRPSQDTLYHSTSGQTAGDGFVIPGGNFLPVNIGSTTTFYLRPVATAGVIDCFVSSGNAWGSTGAKALVTDATSAQTQGSSQKPTYAISTLTGAPAAANYVLLTLESGASKITRVRRVVVSNPGVGTAAAQLTFELIRTTAASSVGTAVTPALYDTSGADAAFSGVARKDGATITAGTQITTFSIFQPVTPTANTAPFVYEFYGQISKALTLPAGITNGIALRCINGNAGAAGFACSLEFTEETA